MPAAERPRYLTTPRLLAIGSQQQGKLANGAHTHCCVHWIIRLFRLRSAPHTTFLPKFSLLPHSFESWPTAPVLFLANPLSRTARQRLEATVDVESWLTLRVGGSAISRPIRWTKWIDDDDDQCILRSLPRKSCARHARRLPNGNR